MANDNAKLAGLVSSERFEKNLKQAHIKELQIEIVGLKKAIELKDQIIALHERAAACEPRVRGDDEQS